MCLCPFSGLPVSQCGVCGLGAEAAGSARAAAVWLVLHCQMIWADTCFFCECDGLNGQDTAACAVLSETSQMSQNWVPLCGPVSESLADLSRSVSVCVVLFGAVELL